MDDFETPVSAGVSWVTYGSLHQLFSKKAELNEYVYLEEQSEL